MSLKEACDYNNGTAKLRCQKTCKSCKKPPPKLPDDCKDDPSWVDADGHTCACYAGAIKAGNLSMQDACDFNVGDAKAYCRRTCRTCIATRNTCVDSVCVGPWKEKLGRCYQCADHSKYCSEDWFRSECPRTCKQCRPGKLAKMREVGGEISAKVNVSNKEVCKDSKCVEAYKHGEECPSCADLGDSFCSEAAFASACPKTCNLCSTRAQVAPCEDIFEKYTCSRYKRWGWCSHFKSAKQQCARTCGACTIQEGGATENSGAGRLLGVRFWSCLLTFYALSVAGW